MKLLSCYIEGYGQIKQKEYTFQDGITTVCEENGAGKTTLASFIKAMFYGLKGYTEKSTEFCDREHFYPFDGGKFGGTLTFFWNGKAYRIERYFGEKRGETLKVYCGGEETDELGEELGKTVFGVDEASFLRTTFIGSGEMEIKSTSSINAKLTGFLQGADEDSNFDRALELLDKARKSYQADRKSKNPTEKIPKTNEEIHQLKEKISNAKEIQKNLEEKYARLDGLKKEIGGLNAQIATAQKENERRTQLEHYDSLLARIAQAEHARKEIASRYPLGLPTEAETVSVNERLVKVRALQERSVATEFSVADGEKLARLEERFARGIPTEETLLEKESEIKTLSRLETEIALEESKEPSERERKLMQRFAYARPTQEELSATAAQVERYKTAKREYEETPAWLSAANAPTEKTSAKGFVALAALAVLLCIVGGVLLALVDALVGGVVLGAGAVLLLADGFLYLNKKSTALQAPMSAMNPEKAKKENALREIEDSIKAALMPYGYHSGNGVAYDFAELQKDVLDYEQYLSAQSAREQALADKRSQKQAIEQTLTAFFRSYGLTGDTYIKLLSDLRGSVREYYSLRDRKTALGADKAAADAEIADNRAKIEAYRRKYGLTELRVGEILEDIREYARLTQEIERGKAQAAAYKEEKGLIQGVDGEKADLTALNALLSEKQNERMKLEREIRDDELEAEKLEENETELKDAEERLAEYKRTHRFLVAAKDFLLQADNRLKDRYVKPILDEFLHYAEIIKEALGEKVTMTKDFEVLFERNGEYRSERYLSTGQRSICALCFRLALIKNMYKNNLPFLILDDPFVALDSEHMEKVKRVLAELSKEMQMVYFTCHESRRI